MENRPPPPSYGSVSSSHPNVETSTIRSGESRSQNGDNSSQGPGGPLGDEIKLYNQRSDRRKYEELSDLYSIIKATEHLEAAYARDACTSDEYTRECTKLISQFKATEKALIASNYITNTETFLLEYNMKCHRAVDRLLKSGVPATVLNPVVSDDNKAAKVAEATQNFITAKDALQLGQNAVDAIQPYISDVVQSLRKLPGLPTGTESSPAFKMEMWLEKLNNMRAVDELNEEMIRQLSLDIDNSYTAFHTWLREVK